MSRKDFLLLIIALLLSIFSIIYFFSPENILPTLVSYYLLFLPALFVSIICIVRIIWGSIENYQNRKYAPATASFLQKPTCYSFRYSSMSNFELRLSTDGYTRNEIQTDEVAIKWYQKKHIQKSRFNYAWTNVENIFLINMPNDIDLKALMKTIEQEKKKSQKNADSSVEVHTSILCIIGQSISTQTISSLTKQFRYSQPIFITTVFDEKTLNIYRAVVPNKKRMWILNKMINTYFS